MFFTDLNFFLKIFDLGEDGSGMSRVATVPLSTTVQTASNIAG